MLCQEGGKTVLGLQGAPPTVSEGAFPGPVCGELSTVGVWGPRAGADLGSLGEEGSLRAEETGPGTNM